MIKSISSQKIPKSPQKIPGTEEGERAEAAPQRQAQLHARGGQDSGVVRGRVHPALPRQVLGELQLRVKNDIRRFVGAVLEFHLETKTSRKNADSFE